MNENEWERNIPTGFIPVVLYEGTSLRRVCTGVVRLPGTGPSRGASALDFLGDLEALPVLPLLKRGLIWHEGWDIPTQFAVDSKGRCFMDGAHGGGVSLVNAKVLLHSCEQEDLRRELQQLLGMTPDRPAWVITALAAGWSPPKDWVDPP